MKKFVVWHNKIKDFVKPHKFLIISEDSIEEGNKDCEVCWGVGKQDINGKEIYADSSICEFTHKENGFKSSKRETRKMTGYFYFHPDELRYEVVILDYEKTKNTPIFTVLSYNFETMSDFKIVDTIQERKLR